MTSAPTHRSRSSWHGVTIGRQLSVDTPTDTLGMWAFGDGSDAYRDIRPLVGALLISETLGGYTLAQFANPILQGPGVGIAQMQGKGNVEVRLARGGLAPRAKEDPEYSWLRPEPAMDQYLEYQQRLIDEIRTHAGLPPSVDGQDVGRGESGEARERIMFTAMAKMRRLRRNLERIIPLVVAAMGAPAGGVEVSWTADPFGTVAARNAEVINDVAAGLLTVDEGRAVKGRPPLEASQAPQPQQEPDDEEEAEAE